MELSTTPNESSEKEEKGGENGCRKDGGCEGGKEEDSSRLQEIRERITQLEAEIEEAVEKEKYDLAGIHPFHYHSREKKLLWWKNLECAPKQNMYANRLRYTICISLC